MMYAALALFAATYVLMLVFSKFRPYIALGSALIFVITGMLPMDNILSAINFNVLLMIAGTMGCGCYGAVCRYHFRICG